MIHKIAILADVHGNESALKAVLTDSEREHVTDYWFLGDLLMPGPGTKALFELINSYHFSVFLRGNWEDCYLAGVNNQIDVNDPGDIYIAKLAHYVEKQLTQKEQKLIEELPLSCVKEVNGLKIGLSHNLPTKNFGPFLAPAQPQENFDQLFNDNFDIAVYAHIHHQTMRYSTNDQLIINPGSIGQPFTSWPKLHDDLRAQYAILEIDDLGRIQVNFKRVSYDIEQEIVLAYKQNLPYFELYEELLREGTTHTHDIELLSQLNIKYSYLEDVKKWYKK
ncbi:MAG: metallophosphoesterase family protein [Vagococcus sp.]|uniref:metallophosphoesterase family protein n=1 Tax=Vagococcus sp. TaxID=1933889 RepID=UPI002FCB379C